MVRRVRWVTLAIAGMSMVAAACMHEPPTEGLINPAPGGFDSNTTQSEPHIAARNNVIVAGWNDFKDLDLSNLTTAYGYSIDGGQTWVYAGALPTGDSGGNNGGDPVLAVDNAGNFYFATIAQDWAGSYYIGVAVANTISTTAVEFGRPVLVAGADLRYLQDKPWLGVDPSSGRVYLCWKDYTGYPQSPGVLRFIRSTSTNPLQFGDDDVQVSPFGTPYFGQDGQRLPTSTEISESGKGCNIGIGPAGEIYVAWVDSQTQTQGEAQTQTIYIVKSTNGGNSFVGPVEIAVMAPSGNTEASGRCGYPALNGYVKTPGWPLIAVDRGDASEHKGTVYIAFAAAGTGGDDDADVFVVRSRDGVNWSSPVAINKAPAATLETADPWKRDNWMPAIAVASDGTVAVSYYDRRSDPENMKIDVYIARSTDGGDNWRNDRVTSAPFRVPQLLPNFDPVPMDCYMGDYNGLAAVGTVFHLVWGDNSYLLYGNPDPNIAYRRIP